MALRLHPTKTFVFLSPLLLVEPSTALWLHAAKTFAFLSPLLLVELSTTLRLDPAKTFGEPSLSIFACKPGLGFVHD